MGEYKFIIYYRPRKSNIIGIPDGLSRIPELYRTKIYTKDSRRFDRIKLATAITNDRLLQPSISIPAIY